MTHHRKLVCTLAGLVAAAGLALPAASIVAAGRNQTHTGEARTIDQPTPDTATDVLLARDANTSDIDQRPRRPR